MEIIADLSQISLKLYVVHQKLKLCLVNMYLEDLRKEISKSTILHMTSDPFYIKKKMLENTEGAIKNRQSRKLTT